MKQPELGKKLAEIRKQKGITQEDLVDRCNVTVRTIQRIESLDVTPRPITLKLIAEALDYDFYEFSSPGITKDKENAKSRLHRAIYTNLEDPYTVALQIKMAWIAGFLYFLTGFPEAAFEYDFFRNEFLAVENEAYVLVKIIAMISFILFARGFIILGYKYNIRLLTYGSYLFLAVFLLNYTFDIFSLGLHRSELKEALLLKALSFGAAEVIFGLGLRGLTESCGRVANYFRLARNCSRVAVFNGRFFPIWIDLVNPDGVA